jgi:aryl-alcohol dehydrogenase-like predicted oxidoreductase
VTPSTKLIPVAVDQGLGVLVRSPLAGGLLSGKYRSDQRPTEGSRQLTDWKEPPVRDTEALYETGGRSRDRRGTRRHWH